MGRQRQSGKCLRRGVRSFYEVGPADSLNELMIIKNLSDMDHEDLRPWEFTHNIRV